MSESETVQFVRKALEGLITSDNVSARTQAIEALTRSLEWLITYERNFDLSCKASRLAMDAWQEAHPNNDHIWPGHTDLCVWLMAEIATLRERIGTAQSLIRHLRDTDTAPRCCRNDFTDKVHSWLKDPDDTMR